MEPGVAKLTRVSLDASTRGRGAGKALVGKIESLSAERGIRTLRLTVRADLAEAHGLYRHLVYEPVPPLSTSPYATINSLRCCGTSGRRAASGRRASSRRTPNTISSLAIASCTWGRAREAPCASAVSQSSTTKTVSG
ncbi:GNAT family N-acetyltransferase [Frigoribacterium sp. CFBP9029]|uniref:GNAT family N-acetyltransferase n=1 Tax=Frigoribacterium sp. CFBP9029 TaxID=3096541 RepID=UPI0039C89337